ncbi:MAG TPA: aldehyde dehydrogenase family protein, partial [Solirubrobacteraceae bacterium]|nr:aldehyde dehydrogenase family protein [Solirubrobacteraceae bacterium]
AAEGAATWRRAAPLDRAATMRGAADLLRERAPGIARDLVREMGKTLAEATVEVAKAADFLDYYASMARLPIGQLLADARPGVEVSVHAEPVGVVLLITPWNDPLLTPARKLAPALFAGNAVVLKPATETPLVALHLARALHDAGLPAGVLATVTGRGSALAGPLLADPRLAAVSFTGSTEVGLGIQRALGGRNVRVQTEMGGKNATAVLADADLALAADTIAAASFGQAGQRCTATSRVVADRAIAAELLELLSERARAVRLGPGLDPQTTMGPLVSASQRDDVLAHLQRAVAEGARVVAGGGAPADERLRGGCYVEPTIYANVSPEMGIWREEVFGPAIAVVEVDGLEEAIAAVNDSPYGLSAAVFTRSLESAARFAAEVDTGQVSVNLPTSGWDVHQPFGGFGDSGSAFKEQGLEALRFYTRTKTVAVRSRG